MRGYWNTARVIRADLQWSIPQRKVFLFHCGDGDVLLLALEALVHSMPGHCYYSTALIMWVALVVSVSNGPLLSARDV